MLDQVQVQQAVRLLQFFVAVRDLLERPQTHGIRILHQLGAHDVGDPGRRVEAALVVRQLQVQVLLQHAKGNPAYFWQHQPH